MKLRHTILIAGAAAFLSAGAHTVVLSENFDGDYEPNFPVMIDAAHNHPARQMQTLFMDATGVTRPWRKLKDVATSSDGYLASHSIFEPAGKASAWICSRALKIEGTGFTLTFDAQSLAWRDTERKSNLWIYITETPVTSEDNLPSEPTWVIEDMPYGEDPSNAVGDFTPYSFSLDEWAGKTVYLNFANLNEDKDLLAIDNVLIQRLDPAELTVEEMPLVVAGEYKLQASIKGTMGEGLKNWTVTARFTNGEEFTASGEALAVGETKDFEIPFTIGGDERLGYTVSVASANAATLNYEGETKGLSFMPNHRVLMEEATGLWCGNCPIGQFTIESMMLDPEMNDKVIPVSVHVPSSAHTNYLAVENYATPLGITIAPAFRLDREFVAMTFSQTHDIVYDPSNPESVAGTILKRAAQLTTMDIALKGEFIVNGNDTTGVRATTTVIPALSTEEGSEYAVGFVLTENNVWLENHPSWAQENYLSGHTELGSEVGGWVSLPKMVPNVRLQDVARTISGYRGIDDSLPKEMKANEEYSFTQEIRIPNTKIVDDGKVNAPAIVAANLSVVAFIIDRSTNTVVNSASYPMTEQSEERFTTQELVNLLSVDEIAGDYSDFPEEYFTLDGLRVAEPQKGQLYIVRKGSEVRKVIK